MGIKEKLQGKVEQFKERRDTERELRDVERKQYEKTYEIEARKQAILAAKAKAATKAKTRLTPMSTRVLQAGQKFITTSGNIFSKAQDKPYEKPAPRASGMTFRTARVSQPAQPSMFYPQGERRFVEIGDKPLPQSALSGGLESAFSMSGSKGGLVDAFYGQQSAAPKETAVSKAMMSKGKSKKRR